MSLLLHSVDVLFALSLDFGKCESVSCLLINTETAHLYQQRAGGPHVQGCYCGRRG